MHTACILTSMSVVSMLVISFVVLYRMDFKLYERQSAVATLGGFQEFLETGQAPAIRCSIMRLSSNLLETTGIAIGLD